jgi:hypothetical protein
MKERVTPTTPDTYAEFIGTYANQMVRLYLSNGERREGVLLVHADYVTFEEQFGGFPIAQIAGIIPLHPQGSITPAPGRSDSPVQKAGKGERGKRP